MCIVRILPWFVGKYPAQDLPKHIAQELQKQTLLTVGAKHVKTVPLSTRHPAVESHVVTFQMMTLTKLWCH